MAISPQPLGQITWPKDWFVAKGCTLFVPTKAKWNFHECLWCTKCTTSRLDIAMVLEVTVIVLNVDQLCWMHIAVIALDITVWTNDKMCNYQQLICRTKGASTYEVLKQTSKEAYFLSLTFLPSSPTLSQVAFMLKVSAWLLIHENCFWLYFQKWHVMVSPVDNQNLPSCHSSRISWKIQIVVFKLVGVVVCLPHHPSRLPHDSDHMSNQWLMI